jgi:secreted trypsin-like serine protease
MRPLAPLAAAALLLGATALTSTPAQAIVGGGTANAKSYPWLAALTSPAVFFRPGGQFCGGVLIKADKVLTGAHCVRQFRYVPGTVNVTFGRSDLAKKKGGTTVKVKKIWINPAFRETDFHGTDVEHNDVAVITLAKKVKIKPVKLAGLSGKTATILGWGETSKLKITDVKLRKATVPFVDWTACHRVYGGSLDAGMTCAGSPKADSCQFDSGGPMFVDTKVKGRLEPRVVGLVSWGKGCAQPGYPGVYVHLARFLDLIKKQL